MTKRQAVAAQGLITSGAYRVMNAHGLLLYCCVGGVERWHDGRIARSMNTSGVGVPMASTATIAPIESPQNNRIPPNDGEQASLLIVNVIRREGVAVSS
jgi:hypothetical protein